ncbi:MAG: hypothetical protein ACHQD9_01665 [Chitinophagales bacterium]
MKRFLLSWLAVYIINSISGFVIHHVILGATYQALSGSLHSDAPNRIGYFIALSITGSFFLTLIYSQWKKKQTITEGAMYGFLIGCWMSLNMALSVYASTQLIPLSLAVQWLVYGIIQYTIAGCVVAWVFNLRNSKANQ